MVITIDLFSEIQDEQRLVDMIYSVLRTNPEHTSFHLKSYPSRSPTMVSRAIDLLVKSRPSEVSLVQFTKTSADPHHYLLEVKLNGEWVKLSRLDYLSNEVTVQFIQAFTRSPWLHRWPVQVIDGYQIDEDYFQRFADRVATAINKRIHFPNRQSYRLIRDGENKYSIEECLAITVDEQPPQ